VGLPRESDKVGTDTEAGTSSGRTGHGWDEDIKNAKGSGGSETNDDDLLNVQAVLRDGVGGDGDHDTLDDVLDSSLDEFSEIKHIAHVIYYTTIKKMRVNQKIIIIDEKHLNIFA